MSGFTLAFQAANFLILVAILYRFLFKPVQKIIARRQQEIEAASKDLEAAKRAAEESRGHYDQELLKARADRELALAAARTAMAEEHDKAVERARDEAGTIIQTAHAGIEREREQATKQLVGQALALATDIAGRLLTQVAGVPVTEAFLGRLCEHLEHLLPDRLQALREELVESATPIVATSPPLETPAKAEWAKRIAERLGTRDGVTFVSDPALVAGAELRLPHTSISFSWRDALNAAREELVLHADAR